LMAFEPGMPAQPRVSAIVLRRYYLFHSGDSMQAELIDIRNHLVQHPPFKDMPEELVNQLTASIEIVYVRAGTQVLEIGQPSTEMYYIRSGAAEIYRRSGELYNRVGEGEIFGQF